jgi:hypothetical protein
MKVNKTVLFRNKLKNKIFFISLLIFISLLDILKVKSDFANLIWRIYL